jgi:hypothetical protein
VEGKKEAGEKLIFVPSSMFFGNFLAHLHLYLSLYLFLFSPEQKDNITWNMEQKEAYTKKIVK